MKFSYRLILTFSISVFFIACYQEKPKVSTDKDIASSQKNNQTESKQNDTKGDSNKETEKIDEVKGMRVYDMAEHELDIHIFIPEKFYNDEEDLPRHVQPDVKHNEGEARWEITVPGDRKWHMVIEEIGKDSSSISDEMERHSAIAFFAYKYEDVSEEQMIYRRVLKSENTTLDTNEIDNLPNYHFYCSREINDYHLVFKNHEQKDFRKLTVKKMLSSARSSY